ncbi:class I SAM-dependent methyltransferase [Spirillospora sp. CA-294931]|uniref:class I SAM-dependent methyltransferase n=1 Tax=Spirillospora sp. CA-294931 TaxID=3240042 RepID=UPI003D908F39
MRVPAFSHLARGGTGGAVAVTALVAILLALDEISAPTAAITVVGTFVLVGLMLTAGMIRRVDEKIERLTTRQAQATQQNADHAAEAAQRSEATTKKLADLDTHVAKAREWVSKDVFTAYQQLEAITDLRALITPRAPMPALRHWALSPDALRHIITQIHTQHPKLIVECGSGASSTWLGYIVQSLGGRIVSLEHDERFAEMTRDLIRAHNLQDTVEIRYAPLTGDQPWYDTKAIEDLHDIDLVIVDGPPGTGGPEARYPAVPHLLPRCTDHAQIMLDDAHRPEEQAVSKRWLEENPTLTRTIHEYDKHLHVFTR